MVRVLAIWRESRALIWMCAIDGSELGGNILACEDCGNDTTVLNAWQMFNVQISSPDGRGAPSRSSAVVVPVDMVLLRTGTGKHRRVRRPRLACENRARCPCHR